MSNHLQVLCLDGEGGYGGSSRSLFASITNMGTEQVTPHLWIRQHGPILSAYRALGVDVTVREDMPVCSSVHRVSRNLAIYGRAFWQLGHAGDFFSSLLRRVEDGIDVVHLNLESQFLIARWLKRHTSVPIVMSIRKHLRPNGFSRWQYGVIGKSVNQFAFITENERDRAEILCGRTLPGAIIYNIAEFPEPESEGFPKLIDGTFNVACLSNFAFQRGIDRLVEVAVELKRRSVEGIRFVVAGNMKLPGSLPAPLSKYARDGGTLADYAVAEGVDDRFAFLGHVTNPSEVLRACSILIKPSREANPWGRDVLEAMAAGLGVIGYGDYDRFVENGETGFLLPEFDAGETAELLADLAADRQKAARLGNSARARVAILCAPKARAQDLLGLWQRTAQSASPSLRGVA